MKMLPTDMAKYPKFTQYVRTQFPKLVEVGPVTHSLKSKGHLTEAEIATALAWGTEPLIVITDLSAGQCGVPSAYGCTRGTNLHQIEIDASTVSDFETAPYRLGTGVGRNSRGTNVFIVGVTLLHELCHLGHFRHGIPENTEAGFAFETATYGQAVP